MKEDGLNLKYKEIPMAKNKRQIFEQIEVEFTNEDIIKLREYYIKNATDKNKEEVEVNWAVNDLLRKQMVNITDKNFQHNRHKKKI